MAENIRFTESTSSKNNYFHLMRVSLRVTVTLFFDVALIIE